MLFLHWNSQSLLYEHLLLLLLMTLKIIKKKKIKQIVVNASW